MRILPAALAALLATATMAAQAKTITVTLVNGHPPVFRWVKHLQESFVPAVNKALEGTDIKLEWKQQYGGSLAKVGEELEAAQDGVADIALVPTIFEPAKLPLQNVTYYTPFVSDDPGLVTQAVQDVQRKIPAMMKAWEANDVVYIGGGFGLDDYLLFTKFPVKGMADLKGRKIGTPGTSINWMKGTGAVGVAGNLTEYYNSLQTGLYDGVVTFATAALPAKIQEVAPYITQIGYGAQYSGGIAANKDWYDAQPEALKKALKAGADAFEKAYTDDLRKATRAALDELVAKGGKLNPDSASLRGAYAKALEDPTKGWVAELQKQKLPAKQVLDAYMKEVRAAGAKPVRDWDRN
ncbi:C4-dicarboxylate TRAP transporter substrate-binding protein [Pigmentiphaga sp. GD03639]|uniref:TRAP-type C4-dicarboxylate transport system, substrate-binding protein n=1 Tax=Pigmentiphaga daeguensis TaxID=414049 RepID=A0ABN1BAU7_9BURK|nr:MULTISPECIES: C4-dicarboxylate TRAP transporter substrate-binding protein [unclassified Pigmentiphaga]MDH2237698.1 C4-dicarboxylate TRAP transporter substrate-binding protein [Pigmentiphaga sp. GD03639]OVZ62229.1 C4-dicarboxylate ABC transporter permease [Pigmentiphaga sp. NML030171]